jgi:hypothetical protein
LLFQPEFKLKCFRWLQVTHFKKLLISRCHLLFQPEFQLEYFKWLQMIFFKKLLLEPICLSKQNFPLTLSLLRILMQSASLTGTPTWKYDRVRWWYLLLPILNFLIGILPREANSNDSCRIICRQLLLFWEKI